MQLIAAGKWSKVKRGWTMVVALRRPASTVPNRGGVAAKRPTRPKTAE
ncbi:MAG TPA: hypothetical protein VL403_18315 [Candidatus Kryptonia bacterium]|nr:hypothetical protein [Candidatus Kryptonia bacterium]